MSGPGPRELLRLAEEEDGFRAAIAASVPNRLARQGDQYIPFFVGEQQAKRLREEVRAIELLNGANVIVMHPSAESGLPHTRPRQIVCMPASYIETATRDQLAETLRHEAIHLEQRLRPAMWEAYAKRQGWTPVPTTAIPESYRLACRINPDTFRPTPFWAWEGVYVPLPLFIPKPNATLQDCEIRWLDIRTGSAAAMVDPPASFRQRYGNSPQPEHPFEIFAVDCAEKGVRTLHALERYLNA
jgi:hypothetical protein